MTFWLRTRSVLALLAAAMVFASTLVLAEAPAAAQADADELMEVRLTWDPSRNSSPVTRVTISLSTSPDPSAGTAIDFSQPDKRVSGTVTNGYSVVFTVPRNDGYRYLHTYVSEPIRGGSRTETVTTEVLDGVEPLVSGVSLDAPGTINQGWLQMEVYVFEDPGTSDDFVELQMTWDAARALPGTSASLNLRGTDRPWDTVGHNSTPSSGNTSVWTVPLIDTYRYLHAFVRGATNAQVVITELWSDDFEPLVDTITLTDRFGRTGELTIEYEFDFADDREVPEPEIPNPVDPEPGPFSPEAVAASRFREQVRNVLTGGDSVLPADEVSVSAMLADPVASLPLVQLIREDFDRFRFTSSFSATDLRVQVTASPSQTTHEFVLAVGEPLLIGTVDLCLLSVAMGHDACTDSPPVPRADICERYLLTAGRCADTALPDGFADLFQVLTSRDFTEVEQFFQEPEVVAELQQFIYDGLAAAGRDLELGHQNLVAPDAIEVELGIAGVRGEPVRFERSDAGVWQMTTESLCLSAAALGPICAGEPLRPVDDICAQLPPLAPLQCASGGTLDLVDPPLWDIEELGLTFLVGSILGGSSEEAAQISEFLVDPVTAVPLVQLIRDDPNRFTTWSIRSNDTEIRLEIESRASGASHEFAFTRGVTPQIETADLCALTFKMGYEDACAGLL